MNLHYVPKMLTNVFPLILLNYVKCAWIVLAKYLKRVSIYQKILWYFFSFSVNIVRFICRLAYSSKFLSSEDRFIFSCTLFACNNILNEFTESFSVLKYAYIESMHVANVNKYILSILNEEIFQLFSAQPLVSSPSPRIAIKDSDESHFHELTFGKSILVLGSASCSNSDEISLLIESHDFVLVHNPRVDIEFLHNIPKQKLICMYRGEYGRAMTPDLFPQNRFCIFKDPATFRRLRDLCSSRLLLRGNYSRHLGSYNGVQDTLLDLLSFSFSKITVGGCNLLLSRSTAKGYRKASFGSIYYNATFLRHPPFMQFELLRRLKSDYPDLLYFDSELAGIISSGLNHYLKKMELVSMLNR